MALPKNLRRIEKQLSLILEKLGIEDEGAQVGTKGIRQTAPETPEQVAERIQYNTYTAREIIERAGSLSAEERAALRAYEAANENRVTVVRALEG